MPPKKERLTAKEVREILKNGRPARLPGTRPLSVRYIRAPGRKYAVVVSSKVAGTSVERHRLRRVLYQAARHVLPSGIHAVFFVSSRTQDPSDVSLLCSKLS